MTARGYELDEAVRQLKEAVTRLDLKQARVKAASGTSVIPPSPLTSTDMQAIINEIQAEIAGAPNNFLTKTYGEQATLVTVATSGAAYTIDCSLGNTFDITLTTNCTLSISNPALAGVDSHIVVILRQGGSGSYTVTWPPAVTWQNPANGSTGGSAPTLWTVVGAIDVVELSTLDGGVTWGGYANPHPSSGFTAGGDLTGTSTSQTVAKINGSPLGTLTPALADRLRWNGSAWVNSASVWRPLMVQDVTSGNWYTVVTGDGDAVMVEA